MSITRRVPAHLLLALLLGSAGCAGLFASEQTPTFTPPPAETTGPPLSAYTIAGTDPKGTTRGQVYVISFGTEPLATPPGQPNLYLHVRLAAANTDTVAWTIDPNDQLLMGDGHAVPPSFAEASGGGPLVTLAGGAQGYLDVYYPLGAPTAHLSLAWRIRRDDERLGGTTVLDLVSTPGDDYAYYAPSGGEVEPGLAADSWWWSDYCFWHDGPRWWPYPRAAYGRRERAAIARAPRPPRDDGGSTGHETGHETSHWRSSASDSGESSKSSWRGSSVSASSADSSASSSSSSSGSSSSSSSGGGKSGWRSGH